MCSAVGESGDVLSIMCKFERGGRDDSEKQCFDLYQEHAWFVLTMKPLDALANLLQVFADRLTDRQTYRLAQWHHPYCTLARGVVNYPGPPYMISGCFS